MNRTALVLLFGFMCSITSVCAADYATEVKNLYADSKDTKVVGKLLPTTEVQILKKENNRVLLAIEGYAEQDSDLAVYFVPGKRILSVGLTKGSNIKFQTISSTQVDGKTYNKVKLQV